MYWLYVDIAVRASYNFELAYLVLIIVILNCVYHDYDANVTHTLINLYISS